MRVVVSVILGMSILIFIMVYFGFGYFGVTGEKLRIGVGDEIEAIKRTLIRIEGNLVEIEGNLVGIEENFDRLTAKLNKTDVKLEKVEGKVDKSREKYNKHKHVGIYGKVERLDGD